MILKKTLELPDDVQAAYSAIAQIADYESEVLTGRVGHGHAINALTTFYKDAYQYLLQAEKERNTKNAEGMSISDFQSKTRFLESKIAQTDNEDIDTLAQDEDFFIEFSMIFAQTEFYIDKLMLICMCDENIRGKYSPEAIIKGFSNLKDHIKREQNKKELEAHSTVTGNDNDIPTDPDYYYSDAFCKTVGYTKQDLIDDELEGLSYMQPKRPLPQKDKYKMRDNLTFNEVTYSKAYLEAYGVDAYKLSLLRIESNEEVVEFAQNLKMRRAAKQMQLEYARRATLSILSKEYREQKLKLENDSERRKKALIETGKTQNLKEHKKEARQAYYFYYEPVI